jgi:hypothetical protein
VPTVYADQGPDWRLLLRTVGLAVALPILLVPVVAGVLVGAKRVGESSAWLSASSAPASEPASEATIEGDAFWCESGCLALVAWNGLVRDDRLRGALAVAYQYNAGWRERAQKAAALGTTVDFAPVTPGLASFNALDNRVRVGDRLRAEDTDVLAAVLAHEVVHASRQPIAPDTRAGAADCFEEEMLAHAAEAQTWSAIPHRSASTTMSQQLDVVVRAWRARRLREYVLPSSPRHNQCLGRPLPNF